MSDAPLEMRFEALSLPPALADNLASLGYRTLTPIQAQSLPPALAGRDVLGQGKTGSGKTAAFGLALLARLDVSNVRVQSLVLCPTRELADQVAEALRRLARTLPNVRILTLCGGAPLGPQRHSLSHGAHIVIGTPGRVEAHLHRGSLDLGALESLVLDEADRMLDMGFQESLAAIVKATPTTRQTLMFSATFDEAVRPLADAFLSDPAVIRVASTHDSDSIRQHFYAVNDERARFDALRRLLLHYRPQSGVVFCNTRRDTREVTDALTEAGFDATALHGDLEQRDRDRTLVQFAQQSVSILVATDVAARGLDIDALDAVFNYQLASDPDAHIHRIGRTGRSGSRGVAATLVGERERYRLEALGERLGDIPETEPLPPAPRDASPFGAPMTTLEIDAGKKQKIRPGDVVGALTNTEFGHALTADQVGNIRVTARHTFVAVKRCALDKALAQLDKAPLKGRRARARPL